ncbi:MAG: hypothetical protein M1831_006385 [Alyxoria varia]|nr:MAG: hypothetical protein M1831_006385 [Alyxoria varia]
MAPPKTVEKSSSIDHKSASRQLRRKGPLKPPTSTPATQTHRSSNDDDATPSSSRRAPMFSYRCARRQLIPDVRIMLPDEVLRGKGEGKSGTKKRGVKGKEREEVARSVYFRSDAVEEPFLDEKVLERRRARAKEAQKSRDG